MELLILFALLVWFVGRKPLPASAGILGFMLGSMKKKGGLAEDEIDYDPEED